MDAIPRRARGDVRGSRLTFRPSPADRPPPTGRAPLRLPRWPRYLVPVVGALIALGILVTIVAGVWTDFLWYRSVHSLTGENYGSVFGVVYGTRWALFFVIGILMAAVTGFNAVLAYRIRPAYRPAKSASERPGVELYRAAVDPHRRLLLGLALGLIGLISGITASGAWRTWLLFINQVPFHRRDPQFHLDISFFVFTYPFLRLVLSFLFAAVLLSLLAALVVHILYGGLGWQARRPKATVGAQVHLFILVGVFVLLKGAAYWVDRWGVDFSQRGAVTTGASYTDVNAVLPAKTVLAVIAVLCAMLFFAGAIRRSGMLPAVGFGLLVLSAILIGGLYPAIIQQFVVKPNELAKESPYIAREIAGTRRAYAVTGVRMIRYNGTLDRVLGHPGRADLGGARGTADGPERGVPHLPAASAGEGLLPVSRRALGGPLPAARRQAARGPGPGGPRAVRAAAWPGQLDQRPLGVHARLRGRGRQGERGGARRHSEVRRERHPAARRARQFPAPGVLRPGGEQLRDRRRPEGGRAGMELDYPYTNARGQQNYTYTGRGGVPIGSLLNRMLYAVKFRELNILLSGAINGDSKILYDRQPLARVAKVAPFLTLDGSPYPVVTPPVTESRGHRMGGGRLYHHRPVPLLPARSACPRPPPPARHRAGTSRARRPGPSTTSATR